MNYEYAIARQFHQMTAFEMATELKRLIDAQPKLDFEQLEAGQVVYYKSSYSDRDQVLRVVKTTPKRKLADVEALNGNYKFRAAKGSYHGKFSVLDEELISFVGLTHELVIDEALSRGLEIPARVRVHYPDKFIETPERFTVKRLRDVLRPEWGRAMTPAAVDAVIADHHGRVRQLQESRVKAVALNPGSSLDYDKYIQNCIDDIDFYRWLRPHVDAGGVFYLNGEKP